MERPLHDVRTNIPETPGTRRAITFVVVALIHIGLIYALVVGLATGVIQKSVQEIKMAVEPPKTEQAAPPPPPMLTKPPPFTPPPEIVIQQEAPTAITTQTHVPPAAPSTPQAESSPVGIGRAHTCSSRFYPEIAQRLSQEGTTVVTFTVTASGDVINPTVANSSGFDDLDRAAIPCVLTWKYKPAIANGKPVAAQWTANVIWKQSR